MLRAHGLRGAARRHRRVRRLITHEEATMKTKHTLIAALFALAGTAAYAQTAPLGAPGPEERHELRQDRERAEHAEKRHEERHEMMRDSQQARAEAARDHEREMRERREREAREHEMREHMEH